MIHSHLYKYKYNEVSYPYLGTIAFLEQDNWKSTLGHLMDDMKTQSAVLSSHLKVTSDEKMLKEIAIPINDDLRISGVRSIIFGHSDITNNYYVVIEIVLNVRINIYIENDYDLSVGTRKVLSHLVSCPIQTVLEVTRLVEDNPALFKNAIRKLRDGKNGV